MGGKEGKKEEPERCRSAQMDVMGAGRGGGKEGGGKRWVGGKLSPHIAVPAARAPPVPGKKKGERVGG